MNSNSVIAWGLILIMAAGGVLLSTVDAAASSLEERRAEREARRAERTAEREARRAEREARRSQAKEPHCSCSARIGFSSPDIGWRGGSLVYIPRVDVSLRVRGNPVTDPPWRAVLKHQGAVSFASTDVSVPGNISFAGEQELMSGSCGKHNYTIRGHQLAPVTLGGLTRESVGNRQKLDGLVSMQATVEGCGFDEEKRAFKFQLKELGNLDIGRWRLAR